MRLPRNSALDQALKSEGIVGTGILSSSPDPPHLGNYGPLTTLHRHLDKAPCKERGGHPQGFDMALATDAKQDEALPGGVWNTLKCAALQWLEHKDAEAVAAIAYYTIFSVLHLVAEELGVATLH